MDIATKIAQALSGQNTTTERSRNLPSAVITIPGTDSFESALWSRKTRDGETKYSYSLSRSYTAKNGEKKLARTFNVDPAEGVQVIFSLYYLYEAFSNDQALGQDARKGFADLALRLATAFEFTTQEQLTQPVAEKQVVNGGALSQQAVVQNGRANGTSSVLGLAG